MVDTGVKRKCPKCGYEMELRAGVVLVCPMCGHTEREKDSGDHAGK